MLRYISTSLASHLFYIRSEEKVNIPALRIQRCWEKKYRKTLLTCLSDNGQFSLMSSSCSHARGYRQFFFKKTNASIENGWLLVTCGPLKRGKDQLLVMGLKWIYTGLLLDQRYTSYLSTYWYQKVDRGPQGPPSPTAAAVAERTCVGASQRSRAERHHHSSISNGSNPIIPSWICFRT